jgi:hypothetical protein
MPGMDGFEFPEQLKAGIATVHWRTFSGSRSLLFRIGLVVLGTSVSQCTMPSFPVVPALNVFKNSQSGLLLSRIIFMVNQLCFQRFEETLSYCIIPTDLRPSLIWGPFPFLLMLCNTGNPLSCSLKSVQAYCTPLSEWNNSCCFIGLFLTAIFQAAIVISLAFMLSLMDLKSDLIWGPPSQLPFYPLNPVLLSGITSLPQS